LYFGRLAFLRRGVPEFAFGSQPIIKLIAWETITL
jgi:hypothetical protein